MSNFNQIMIFQKIIFIIMFIVSISLIIFVFILIFNPKIRGKLLNRQIKAVKQMSEDSKEDMEEIITNLSTVSIRSKNRIIHEQEDTLKEMAHKQEEIYHESIKKTAQAVQEGLSSHKMYCKHCGQLIADDSIFCKYCGKKQE